VKNDCYGYNYGRAVVSDLEEQQVKIRLLDVNDESPEFKNVPRPFLATVAANAAMGTSIYQLMAQDADQDGAVRYILESGWSISKCRISQSVLVIRLSVCLFVCLSIKMPFGLLTMEA